MAQTSSPQRSAVLDLVTVALREVLLQSNQPHPIDVNEETTLIGRNAVIDSIGLVTLVVEVEQAIEEKYGFALTLANERAMSLKRSPFLTVRTLTDYVIALIAEEASIG